jgi:single-stranded DNA-specific DHH superfamily exonuclease
LYYPFDELCGWDRFKLIQALGKNLGLTEGFADYLDLVATAIAADTSFPVEENQF